jgi:predicted Zn-dependent protease
LLVVRARAQLALGHPDAAADSFRKVLERRPRALAVHLLLAQAQLAAGDADAARQTLQGVLKREPDQPDALVSLARLEAATGNLEKAQKLAGRFAKADPDNRMSALLQPHVLFLAGKYDEAIAALEGVAAEFRKTPEWVMLYADANWVAGHRAASVEALKGWVDAHDGDTAAMDKLAQRQIVMGRSLDAEHWLTKVLEHDPDNVAALNNLAYLRRDSDLASARKLAAKAYELRPGQPGIQDTYGWIMVMAGDVDQGLKLLKAAQQKLHKQPSVRYHYAAALAKAGQNAVAKQVVARLLAEPGNFPERDQAKRLMEQLR